MDNTFINIFNGVKDKDTSKKISVLDVLWKIMEGEWESIINAYRFETNKKRKEELKKRLPAVTFSGSLSKTGRLDKNIDKYTNIVVCDIDKIPPGKLIQYKKKLNNDNYVLAYFESPSKGLKVLMKVDSNIKFHKSHAFIQIEDYILRHYDIKIDPSGKNPSRLCFISYDPDMYYNENSDTFPVDISIDYEALEVASTMKSVRNINNDFITSGDSKYVFDVCCKWINNSATGSYHKGNRNNFIFSLSCRLSEAGMDKDLAISMILERYPSMGFKEIKITVNSAYKHTNHHFGLKPIKQRRSNQTNIF